MTFGEFAKIIEDYIFRRKRVTVYEIMAQFSDIMEQNKFCLCDINDIIHNLERQDKIEVKGSLVLAKS